MGNGKGDIWSEVERNAMIRGDLQVKGAKPLSRGRRVGRVASVAAAGALALSLGLGGAGVVGADRADGGVPDVAGIFGISSPGIAHAAEETDAGGVILTLPDGFRANGTNENSTAWAWVDDYSGDAILVRELSADETRAIGDIDSDLKFMEAEFEELVADYPDLALLDIVVPYENEGIAFNVFYLYTAEENTFIAVAAIPLANESGAMVLIYCPDYTEDSVELCDYVMSGLVAKPDPRALIEQRLSGLPGAVSLSGQTQGARYVDGTYTASAKGIGGDVPLTVVIQGGRIVSVEVGENGETQGIGSKAIEQIPPAIVEAQGIEGVGGVSGASVTSGAIFTAMEDILAQAESGGPVAAEEPAEAEPAEEQAAEEAEPAEAAEVGPYADGTYTASAKGIGGDVPLTVVIQGGRIVSVEVGENGETQGIGSKAIEQMPPAIVAANGIEGVDGVSGASVTSKAIFTAMEDILAQAAAGPYADGTYEASAKGIGGDVPLTVTIEGGVITSVEVGENGETPGIGSKAIEQLPTLIVEANGIEGVDGVSGASVTSKAIFTAMGDILEQASR